MGRADPKRNRSSWIPSKLLTIPGRIRVPWMLVIAGPYAAAFESRFFFRLQMFVGMGVGLIVGWNFLTFVDGPVRLVLSFALGWPMAGALLSAAAMWRVATARVALDEGGVRCRAGGRPAYWPFELTGRGYIQGGALPELVIEDRDGTTVARVPVVGSAGQAEASVWLARYESGQRAVARKKAAGVADLVDRKGRTLDVWREALDALAARAQEPGAPDPAALLAVFADPAQRAEIRAGAAYALLARRSPDFTRGTRDMLSEASPPIVLLLARLAPGGDKLGLDDALRRATPYLDVDDRSYAELAR